MCQLAYYSGHNFIYQTSLNDTRSQIVACLETGHTKIGTAAYKRDLLSLIIIIKPIVTVFNNGI